MGDINQLLEDIRKNSLGDDGNSDQDNKPIRGSPETGPKMGDPTAYSGSHVEENMQDLIFEGNGGSRNVYRIQTSKYGAECKDQIIKFARSRDGVAENKREMQTWMTVRSRKNLRSYFCPIQPIIDPQDSQWIMMDYADTQNGNASRLRSELENKIGNAFDIRAENVGKHPELGDVVVDYPWGADCEVR